MMVKCRRCGKNLVVPGMMICFDCAKTKINWMTIRDEIMEFAYAMETILSKHDKEKGDSWKECPLWYLESKLKEEMDELLSCVEKQEQQELIDIANIVMMLWHRKKKQREIDNG